MKTIPTMSKYMTTTPHSVGFDQTLRTASELMKTHGIRHLPVMKAGQLVGILSDRDLKLALSLRGVDAEVTTVDEIASDDVVLVKPEAKLDEVSRTMAEKRIGSVLIVDNHHLVGIFTATDALKALNELLHTRLA